MNLPHIPIFLPADRGMESMTLKAPQSPIQKTFYSLAAPLRARKQKVLLYSRGFSLEVSGRQVQNNSHCRSTHRGLYPGPCWPAIPGFSVCPFSLGLATPASSARVPTGDDLEINTREGSRRQGRERPGESSGDAKWRRGREEETRN